MTSSQLNILKKALLEVEREEVAYLKELPNIDTPFSEEFEEKIKKIAKKRNSFFQNAIKTIPRRIALAFIAAIITFVMMMSISAIRIPVVNFFVNIYEEFVGIFIDSEENSTQGAIETVYLPTYIPNEYSISETEITDTSVKTTWSCENNKITLCQDMLDKNLTFIDNESSNYTEIELNSKQFYYTYKNNLYFITWIEDDYLFSLSAKDEMDFEELKLMISNMKPVS